MSIQLREYQQQAVDKAVAFSTGRTDGDFNADVSESIYDEVKKKIRMYHI